MLKYLYVLYLLIRNDCFLIKNYYRCAAIRFILIHYLVSVYFGYMYINILNYTLIMIVLVFPAAKAKRNKSHYTWVQQL